MATESSHFATRGNCLLRICPEGPRFPTSSSYTGVVHPQIVVESPQLFPREATGLYTAKEVSAR